MAKILIVDDDPLFIGLIQDVLSKEGHEILIENDSVNVLNVLAIEKPDLLITDMVMPDKEGVELIIETKTSFPNLPIIAVSGTKDYCDLAKGLEVNAALTKPIYISSLIETISKVLNQ